MTSTLSDCGFCSVLPLVDEDKRIVEASWWEGPAVGKTGSCSSGQGHSQWILIPIFCWWLGLCSLLVFYPDVKLQWDNDCNRDRLQKALGQHAVAPRMVLFSALTLQQATVYPHLPWRLLDTQRQVWLSLLWGHCSFLLGPGAQAFVCTLQVSVSPVLWKFCNHIPLAFKFPGEFSRSPFAGFSGWEICCGP